MKVKTKPTKAYIVYHYASINAALYSDPVRHSIQYYAGSRLVGSVEISNDTVCEIDMYFDDGPWVANRSAATRRLPMELAKALEFYGRGRMNADGLLYCGLVGSDSEILLDNLVNALDHARTRTPDRWVKVDELEKLIQRRRAGLGKAKGLLTWYKDPALQETSCDWTKSRLAHG